MDCDCSHATLNPEQPICDKSVRHEGFFICSTRVRTIPKCLVNGGNSQVPEYFILDSGIPNSVLISTSQPARDL